VGRPPGPERGQELHDGPPAVPRQSATVILLRGGAEGLEVLLMQRNPAARVLGGAWVFPGGSVDAAEGGNDEPHRAAAVRELREEAGIELPDPGALVEFSRWITPEVVRRRFDTRFFLVPAPEGAEPRPDGVETVDSGWFTPRGALDAHDRGEIELVFPTIKTFEQLAAFGTADELLSWARGRRVEPVQPKVVGDGETARIVLPGEPGYTP
jgi:8-oxo-dGTP pyrophosphatase MutT (NUDIX family)